MTATRAPHPIPLSIRAEDLLIAAAIIAALGDRPGRAHLRTLADRLDRCARVCWRQYRRPLVWCAYCGKMLLRRRDGTPRQHAATLCPGKDDGYRIEREFARHIAEREYQ